MRDTIPNSGDHAGPWETSLMMYLRPDLVDLEKAEGPEGMPGLHEKVRAEASAEYGAKILGLMTEKVTEVNARLLAAIRNPEETMFDVPVKSICRGARAIAKLREEEGQ